MTDADKLRGSSLYIRKWVLRQPSVKEESITDWLLYDISEKIDGIYYKAFTRHEEARKTGADWEWWFVFNEFSIKLRIQAKRVFLKKDNYASLAYTNQYGLQIEKLLYDSTKENFLPLYAFYTSNVKVTMCRKKILDEGVYLAGGKTIYRDFIINGKKSVSSDEIFKRTNPLSCFFGCPLSHENGRSKLFVEFFRKYYPNDSIRESEEDNDVSENEEMLGFYEEPPNYVTSFIQHSVEGLPDWWESEFSHYIENINSLLVYDVRSK